MPGRPVSAASPPGRKRRPTTLPPPAHLDVEAPRAHAGDDDASRRPASPARGWLPSSTVSEHVGCGSDLAGVPAPVGQVPGAGTSGSPPTGAAGRTGRLAHEVDVAGELVGPQHPGRRGGRRRLSPLSYRAPAQRRQAGATPDRPPTRGTTMAIATLKMLTLDSSDARRDATLLVGGARLGGRPRAGRVRHAHRPRRRGARASARVEDHEAPAWPNEHGTKQFHLDLAVDDLDAGVGRVRRARRHACPTSSRARRGGCCSTRAATRSASPSPRTGADAADAGARSRWTASRHPARWTAPARGGAPAWGRGGSRPGVHRDRGGHRGRGAHRAPRRRRPRCASRCSAASRSSSRHRRCSSRPSRRPTCTTCSRAACVATVVGVAVAVVALLARGRVALASQSWRAGHRRAVELVRQRREPRSAGRGVRAR